MEEDTGCFYSIKLIRWDRGGQEPDKVPILMQDQNGPCPLIAIVNILLLRGSMNLPVGVGEVAQVRLAHVQRFLSHENSYLQKVTVIIFAV